MNEVALTPFNEVISAFQCGEMVIIIDAADRENEGDLAVATERLTAEYVNFMLQEARGLVCVSIGPAAAERLKLPYQVCDNHSPFGTPFTVSVDHRSVGESGFTAAARTQTMLALLREDSQASEFSCPGHVFPLVANAAGVLGRQGQTEGSYDLARIAGLKPSGVICEILNPDGTQCRGPALSCFAQRFNFKITSVQEIIRYRLEHEILLRETACRVLDTDYGKFKALVMEDSTDNKEHLALVYGDLTRVDPERGLLVRIHSECLTGDVLGSLRCDCGEQLDYSARHIVAEGAGVILYLRQEGRGIGLSNKLKAYELQDGGEDTVEANVKLGFPADSRDYAVAGKILSLLGVRRIRLLTNNPEKLSAIERFGISIVARVPVVIHPNEHSKFYLDTKRSKLGHLI